ncbi:MAG: hypothetical protein EXX96DRAFT_554116 [Benjaminiella poitrasii]|nr:MAG: hypothetical protein EXX96DRAFT_554116 [Benjaminiella poitrasii]
MSIENIAEEPLQTKERTLEDIAREALEESKTALKDHYTFQKEIKNVAVIGAGPSGLCSARRLRDLGFSVKVFERNPSVGGVWVYSETSPPKPKIPTSRIKRELDYETSTLSISEPQKKLYEMTPEVKNKLLNKCPPSACYRDLYTNTCTKLSGLPDFPFPVDTPMFCPHHVVYQYLQDYAVQFDLLPLIKLNTSVDRVAKNPENQTWELTLSHYDTYTSGMVRETRWKEVVDAVVIANGCHQESYVPDFKHLTEWNKLFPSKAFHSKQFRRPEDYKDQNVLVIGGSISAVDVVRSIDGFAKRTTLAIKGPFESPFPLFNVIRSKIPKSVNIKPNVAAFSNKEDEVDGTVSFEDGTALEDIDQVIFCTGFMNRMAFLGDAVIPKNDIEEAKLFTAPRPIYDDVPDSHVVMGPRYPLNVYRDVFLISDPTLTFVGLPPYFSTLSQFDTQAQAVARVWSGYARLPSKEWMQKFTSENKTGVNSIKEINTDRKRREPLLVWLNHHADELRQVDLPKLENYQEDYEKEYGKVVESWGQTSDENFKRTKAYIYEHYL